MILTAKPPRKLNFVGFKLTDEDLLLLIKLTGHHNCTRSNLLISLVKDYHAKVFDKNAVNLFKG